MQRERMFQTPDVYLSAAVTMLLRTEPSYQVLNGKTFFCFPATDDLYRAMGLYNSGVEINAMEFSGVVKRLRGEAISRRSGSDRG
ncbi:MAG: hypothetical protein A4E63_02723 [Syntrophorhabdus sp. PtaU1.Bin050]|nr:MAG: hypothetical protein A4E63_02723 [Syntrophorhabdus sp. PtaU1.Bin050]